MGTPAERINLGSSPKGTMALTQRAQGLAGNQIPLPLCPYTNVFPFRRKLPAFSRLPSDIVFSKGATKIEQPVVHRGRIEGLPYPEEGREVEVGMG